MDACMDILMREKENMLPPDNLHVIQWPFSGTVHTLKDT